MIEWDFITGSFITIQSKTAAGICRKSPIISHDKESFSDSKFALSTSRFGSNRSGKIGFFKCITLLYGIVCITDFNSIALYLYGFTRKPDNPFDIWDSFAWRNKDNNIASLKFTESRRDLIDNDKIIFLERG